MSRKIMGLAEVQIWISMNVYRGIGKKNDGSEPKYRFGFLLMYKGNKQKSCRIETKYRFVFIQKKGRKMMGYSQSTDLDFYIYL